MGEPARKTDRRYTYRDYRSWPDDERWELIDGVAWNMSPAPVRRHQGILTEILTQLLPYLKGKPCKAYAAPFDVLLPERPDQAEDEVSTVVQPDISVVCDLSRLTDRGCTGAPDLVVEILSPHTARKDMEVKRALYERHGVHEYWIDDPGNRCVQAYVLREDGHYPEEPTLYLADADLPSVVLADLKLQLPPVFQE